MFLLMPRVHTRSFPCSLSTAVAAVELLSESGDHQRRSSGLFSLKLRLAQEFQDTGKLVQSSVDSWEAEFWFTVDAFSVVLSS